MKPFVITFLVFSWALYSNAQFSLSGKVLQQNKHPVEAASLSLEKDGVLLASTISSVEGLFIIDGIGKIGKYKLHVEQVSIKKQTLAIDIKYKLTDTIIVVQSYAYFLEPLELKSLRASDKAPFAKTNISKSEIEQNNLGQDLPFILNQTPSVVVNSDAGNGIGYTGIRIRGSDATRINVTMNGIPYNDAESQGTYFVDMPDIASSVNSIQVQRGVGTSSNGAGAFGASINLSTNEFNEKAYGEMNNSYGSFNSWKNTVKVGSGLLNNHITVDARLSRISSNGFIDRAASDLKAAYFSVAYVADKSSIRFNFISGKEKTYQAWNGVPGIKLINDRTYNSAGTEKPGEPYNNETDNYGQDHFQLFFNHSFSNKLAFNTGVFLSKGRGYYEQYKAGAAYRDYAITNPIIGGDTLTTTDLVRQLWLANSYYGQIFSLQYKHNTNQVTLGGGWTRYEGNHFGKIIWAQTGIEKEYEYYKLDALKTDYNLYAKWQKAVNKKIDLYTDLQYRHVGYSMNGFRNNPTIKVNRVFNFINPKAGISYSNKGYKIFLSYALANKEPNRDDFEAGVIQQPKHETLHDFEIGIEKRYNRYSWGANVYYMIYRNQLILTGKVNDVGAYTRLNVPGSYRVGVELQGKANIKNWLSLSANIAYSKNKIKTADEFLDDYDNGGQIKIQHNNATIAFSPDVVGGATVNIVPIKNVVVSLTEKYVSRQYLDNTQNNNRSLNAYLVQDCKASYKVNTTLLSHLEIVAAIYNVLNRRYEPNGYTYSYIFEGKTITENFYYPMAGRNFMLGLNVKF